MTGIPRISSRSRALTKTVVVMQRHFSSPFYAHNTILGKGPGGLNLTGVSFVHTASEDVLYYSRITCRGWGARGRSGRWHQVALCPVERDLLPPVRGPYSRDGRFSVRRRRRRYRYSGSIEKRTPAALVQNKRRPSRGLRAVPYFRINERHSTLFVLRTRRAWVWVPVCVLTSQTVKIWCRINFIWFFAYKNKNNTNYDVVAGV